MTGLWRSENIAKQLGIGRLARSGVRLLRHTLAAHAKSGPMEQLHLALVIPLEGPFARELTKLQLGIMRKYGHNPGLEAPPHITLKMGFDATNTEPFEQYLEQLASEVTAFEITAKNFDSFDEGIFFMNVESSGPLEKLRQRILTDLSGSHGIQPEFIEGSQFRFHITLAYGLNRRDFAELVKTHATCEMNFRWIARRMDLLCFTGRNWVSCHHAFLQESNGCSSSKSTI
jgi:2'-5' RNA ligase